MNSKNDKLASAGFGAGSGTMILLLVKALPNTFFLKNYLIILSPAIATGLSLLFDWGFCKIKQYLDEKRLKQNLKILEEKCKEEISDPGISEERRILLKKRLEQIKDIERDYYLKQIKSISFIEDTTSGVIPKKLIKEQ